MAARRKKVSRKAGGNSGTGKRGDGRGVRLKDLHDNVQGPAKYERAAKIKFRQIKKSQTDEILLFTSTAIGIVEPSYRVVIGIKAMKNGQFKVYQSYALVRCECKSHYFWYWYGNNKAKCLYGDPFPKYRRKTPVTDPRYPPKNPKHIPGLCKHLEKYSQVLIAKGLLK